MAVSGPSHPPVFFAQLGRIGLAEVVSHGAEQQHGAVVIAQALAFGDPGRRVDNVHRVRSHIAFGMPLRILRHRLYPCE